MEKKGFFRVSIDNVDVQIVDNVERPIVQMMVPNEGCQDPEACNFCGYTPESYTWTEPQGPDGPLVWALNPNPMFWEFDCNDGGSEACDYLDAYCTNFYGENICGGIPIPEIPNTGGQRCGGCQVEQELSGGQSVWQLVGGYPVYQDNGYGYEHTWCEICSDPEADNYTAPITDYIHSPSMCYTGKCITPQAFNQQYFPACNVYVIGSEPGMTADNVYHDESKCVYAHAGCLCQADGTAALSPGSTCLDCMENQPLPPSPSPMTIPNMNMGVGNEWVKSGICDCDKNPQTVQANSLSQYFGPLANSGLFPGAVGLASNGTGQVTFCSSVCEYGSTNAQVTYEGVIDIGSYETVACGCGETILPEYQNTYCNCGGTELYNQWCGCGTDFVAPYTDHTTMNISDNPGTSLYAPNGQNQNGSVVCDCDGTPAVRYARDQYGTGYADPTQSSVNIIYACPDIVSQITISTPASPVQGGWTNNFYNCDLELQDCAGNCPPLAYYAGDPGYGAAVNECGECVPLAQQYSGWVENCCETPIIEANCAICGDAYAGTGAFNDPQIGAMLAAPAIGPLVNPDTDSLDQIPVNVIISYDGEVTTTNLFHTCNCENLAATGDEFVNYYDISNELYKEDGCGSCNKLNDPARISIGGGTISGQLALSVAFGVTGSNIVQDSQGNLYCGCSTAPGGVDHVSPEQSSVVMNVDCCGSNVIDCSGNCVPPNTTQVEDCEGVCGGSAVEDECGVCNGPGVLEGNCDCAGHVEDCFGACGGTAVVDPCGTCRESVDANNYGAACWVCGDENAENYVALSEDNSDGYVACANNSCCDYLTLEEIILYDEQTQAIASGTAIEEQNWARPWAVVDDIEFEDFYEGTPSDPGGMMTDRTLFHQYYADPVQNITDAYGPWRTMFQWLTGWLDYSEEMAPGISLEESFSYPGQGTQNMGVAAVYEIPKISFRVQKVSATNLKIVCEAPAVNALVSYTIYDPNDVVIQSNVYYYGTIPYGNPHTDYWQHYGNPEINGVATYNNAYLSGWYSDIVANELDTYSNISRTFYYFYIDADAPFDNLDVETIFASVDENGNLRYPDIMKVGYMTTQASQYFISGEEVGTGDSFDTIGTLQQGLNYMLPTPNVDLPDVPVYHVYRIEVKPGASFTIHFEDIPGIVTPPPVYGCMEEGACNYDSNANTPSECTYPEEGYYCDGSVVPVYGCMDLSAHNFNPNANTSSVDYPCDYLGCMDPLADNYSQIATIDDPENPCLYSLPCNNIPQTPICCEPQWFNSASQNDYTIVNNIPVANDECNICDSSVCTNEDNNLYVCTDENAINTWAGEWIDGLTVSSNAVCDYFENEPSTLHVRIRVFEYEGFTQKDINSIDWVVYDTSSNLVASHTYMSLNAPVFQQNLLGGVQTFLYNLDNITTPSTCLWFIPIGYVGNSIWDHVELDIMFGGESLHKLYGYKGPTIKNAPLVNLFNGAGTSPYTNNFNTSTNYSSTIDTGVFKIVKALPCLEGCKNDNNTLQTESCVGIVKKDSKEFTEIFLFVDTAQENSDFSSCSVSVVDLDNGRELFGMVGFEPGQSYKRRFVVEKASTRVGIKAIGNGESPITYKLVSEFGKIITYKTFK